MASAANTGNQSDSEEDLTGFQDDNFEDQEQIIMGVGKDLLPTSPLLLQMVPTRGQRALATGPDFPFCKRPECPGCLSTCRKMATVACQLCERDLEHLCERREQCQFEYSEEYEAMLGIRNTVIHSFTPVQEKTPLLQPKLPQKTPTTTADEEQQVASTRREEERGEGVAQEDLQNSKEAPEAVQQLRTPVLEQDTQTFSQQDAHAISQQGDLRQEDPPQSHQGFGWPDKEDVDEDEEEEKIYPQERQKVTFREEDKVLYGDEPMGETAA